MTVIHFDASAFKRGLFLFGSYAEGTEYKNSDIDLCFIVPNKEDMLNVYHSIMAHAEKYRGAYDIRFFEEFPLPIKMEIIQKGIPVLSNDINGVMNISFFIDVCGMKISFGFPEFKSPIKNINPLRESTGLAFPHPLISLT